MKKIDVKIASLFVGCLILAAIQACSGAPAPATENAAVVTASKDSATGSAAPVPSSSASDIPASYKDIQFPEYKYVAPYPKDYRVEIADGIVGYIVSDRRLPLVNFTVYFENPRVPA